jgi:spermidine/putrescine transport system ATP-binding protein
VVLPGGRHAEVATGGRRFAAGGAALLMVRPERLHLGVAEPNSTRTSLPVRCTDVLYQGAQLRCALVDPQGGELVAELETDEPRQGVLPGAALWASWDPACARLVAPEV